MIMGVSWPVWLAWLLAAFFVVNGAVNIVGPRGMRDGFARWGYPPWFHLFNGVLQLATGVLIAHAPTRLAGLALGALVCLAVFATLVRHRETAHLPPGLVLFAVILVTAFGVRAVAS
jgi:hypothetical protein